MDGVSILSTRPPASDKAKYSGFVEFAFPFSGKLDVMREFKNAKGESRSSVEAEIVAPAGRVTVRDAMFGESDRGPYLISRSIEVPREVAAFVAVEALKASAASKPAERAAAGRK